MPGYKETVQTFIRMKIFFGLIAQFGLVLGQVNREDFNEIAQVRFFEERRKWKLIGDSDVGDIVMLVTL